MNKTTISWTDYTSNPLRARGKKSGLNGWYCSRVSLGCLHCYSERINRGRLGNRFAYTPENAEHVEWLFIEKEFEAWRKRKTPSKIFVCDMIDLFHESIPFWMVMQVFCEMARAERHTFQVLSKRPRRVIEFFKYWDKCNEAARAEMRPFLNYPLKNVWLGVSVENQAAADTRIPLLLRVPAAIHFISAEPLLEQIEIEPYLDGSWSNDDALPTSECNNLGWAIVGGESGPRFRPMDLEWARFVRDECTAAGVPFFFKQEAGLRPGTNPTLDGVEWKEFPS